jgi:hypothetical protein
VLTPRTRNFPDILSKHSSHWMRFEVHTTVKLLRLVFWVVTPCGIVGLNVEITYASKIQVSTYQSTRRCNTAERHRTCPHSCRFLRRMVVASQNADVDFAWQALLGPGGSAQTSCRSCRLPERDHISTPPCRTILPGWWARRPTSTVASRTSVIGRWVSRWTSCLRNI